MSCFSPIFVIIAVFGDPDTRLFRLTSINIAVPNSKKPAIIGHKENFFARHENREMTS